MQQCSWFGTQKNAWFTIYCSMRLYQCVLWTLCYYDMILYAWVHSFAAFFPGFTEAFSRYTFTLANVIEREYKWILVYANCIISTFNLFNSSSGIDGTHNAISSSENFPILIILSAVSLASLWVALSSISFAYASKTCSSSNNVIIMSTTSCSLLYKKPPVFTIKFTLNFSFWSSLKVCYSRLPRYTLILNSAFGWVCGHCCHPSQYCFLLFHVIYNSR